MSWLYAVQFAAPLMISKGALVTLYIGPGKMTKRFFYRRFDNAPPVAACVG